MPLSGGTVCAVEVPLHPDVAALAGLLGTWVGEGAGEYPTIEPFRYREEVVFGHAGKPFLAYRQATVRLDTGLPAHAESGYLRGVGGDRVELVLAHPTGVAELAEGEVSPGPDGLTLHLRTSDVVTTATAKEVRRIERHITVAGDTLRYDLAMAAVGQPHQHHLSAELTRTR
jgi:THAP4-like, heme-binding beta-barrel domain